MNNDNEPVISKIKNWLYEILGVEQFIRYWKNFSTALISLHLIALIICIQYDRTYNSGGQLYLGLCAFMVWILIYVSEFLKKLTVEEIQEGLERQIFDRLREINEEIKKLKKEVGKVADIIYDENQFSTSQESFLSQPNSLLGLPSGAL